MQLSVHKSFCFCQFCGAKIMLDDEAQHIEFDNVFKTGYDFESGRQAAFQSQTAKFTLNRIKSLTFALIRYEIFIDGVSIAILKNGESVSKTLAVGDHTLKIVDLTNKKVDFSNTISVPQSGADYSFSANTNIKLIDNHNPEQVILEGVKTKPYKIASKVGKVIQWIFTGILALATLLIIVALISAQFD